MRFLFVVIALVALASMGWWAMHWLLFGLVIWGVMCLLRGPRHPRRYERMYREPPRPVQPPKPAPRNPSSELPLEVQVKVEQIRRKAEMLGQQGHRFPLGSEALYIVRATAEDYLPRTLNAFLAVPPASREQPVANGKTPLQELKEQLSLLDAKLDEIAEDLQRENVDRLLANRRFLEERFGRVVTL